MRSRRLSLSLRIACLAGASVLAAFQLPGVLLYPVPPPAPETAVLVALQKEANQALARQVAQMQQDLSGNVCVAGDRLMRHGPGGAPVPANDADDASLPPPPVERIAAPAVHDPAAAPAEQRSLADLLDAATVLVLARGGQREGSGFGTGFFVAPGLVVTNLHVVGDPPADEIWVTSKALNRATRAKLLARSPKVEIGGPDFALLEVEDGGEQATLSLASPADRLQNVVAAGFPKLVMDTDAGFMRLRAGDRSAVPEMAVSQGVVTARQSPAGTPLILHTASVSGGNSGGPLVDQCGRVVGMNTFVRTEREQVAQMSYALASEALATFLAEAGVEVAVASDQCRPYRLEGRP